MVNDLFDHVMSLEHYFYASLVHSGDVGGGVCGCVGCVGVWGVWGCGVCGWVCGVCGV
jgi:hypothetical protein